MFSIFILKEENKEYNQLVDKYNSLLEASLRVKTSFLKRLIMIRKTFNNKSKNYK
jgi:hypothetical protein